MKCGVDFFEIQWALTHTEELYALERPPPPLISLSPSDTYIHTLGESVAVWERWILFCVSTKERSGVEQQTLPCQCREKGWSSASVSGTAVLCYCWDCFLFTCKHMVSNCTFFFLFFTPAHSNYCCFLCHLIVKSYMYECGFKVKCAAVSCCASISCTLRFVLTPNAQNLKSAVKLLCNCWCENWRIIDDSLAMT